MGCCKCLLYLLVLGAIATGIVFYYCPGMCSDSSPIVLKDNWWGGQLQSNQKIPADNPAIKKFAINVKEADLQDLQRRLNHTKLSDPLLDGAFHYGFNTVYLKEVLNYWNNDYIPKWKKTHEVYLNKYDQFLTQIEGLNVHYLHIKPKVDAKTKVLPLVLIHGWPGSVAEFYKIIPLLTTPRKDQDFVFEVICPSIPGYGFSDAPKVSGFSILDAARVFNKLMDRLGHKTYYVQGGDWGSIISKIMAIVYPERIDGVHVNMATPSLDFISGVKLAIGKYLPDLVGFTEKDTQKLYPGCDKFLFIMQETGYMHIQATKPDTAGVGLSDSPAGLAAYILEKFSTWTNPKGREDSKGGLVNKYTLDELLHNVMVYWTTNTITSSMRFYKESVGQALFWPKLHRAHVKVPSAIANFPHEIINFPKSFFERVWEDLVQFTEMDAGGHFGAMEEPKLLAEDIWSFVFKIRSRPSKTEKKKEL